jgi:hypothetical protein
MPTPTRAAGEFVKLYANWESTLGTIDATKANGFVLRAHTLDLSPTQAFDTDVLLGDGADPLVSERGAIDMSGSADIPIDKQTLGYYLALLFGAETAAPQQGASGWIDFGPYSDDLPAASSTITLNGTAWTFVASGASGAQTNIGATVEATVTTLATNLNASASVEIAKCTYTADGRRLWISHDTATTAGNTYTLAASATANATPSAATLTGGGLYKHTWRTGVASSALPSMSCDVFHEDIASGNRYQRRTGIKAGSIALTRSRTGAVRATLGLAGRTLIEAASSAMGTPTDRGFDAFGAAEGWIRQSGKKISNIVAAQFSIDSTLRPLAGLDDGGLISAIDRGQTQIGFSLTARFSLDELRAAAAAGTSLELKFGFRDVTDGASLLFTLHDCRLNRPAVPIRADAIEASYTGNGYRGTGGYSATVELVNSVSALYLS